MAETRETQVLEDVIESTEIENPRTTEEAILAQVIAGDEVTINARTRYQTYLKELSSISGGNPNSVEEISTTIAELPDVVNISEIIQNIDNKSITVYGSQQGLSGYLVATTYNSNNLQFSIRTEYVHRIFLVSIVYNVDGTLHDASSYVLATDGTYTKSEFDTVTPVTLIIIHHPLPEDNT